MPFTQEMIDSLEADSQAYHAGRLKSDWPRRERFALLRRLLAERQAAEQPPVQV